MDRFELWSAQSHLEATYGARRACEKWKIDSRVLEEWRAIESFRAQAREKSFLGGDEVEKKHEQESSRSPPRHSLDHDR